MARVPDPGRAQLEAAFPDDLVLQQTQASADELLQALSHDVPLPEPDAGGHLPGEDVIAYLDNARLLVEARVEEWTRQWSGIRWLWHLRRVPPDVVHGSLRSSYRQLRRLAEIISARSTIEERADLLGAVPWPIGDEAAATITRYCAGVRLIHHLQSQIRRVKRGAHASFPAGPLPSLLEQPDTAAAVALYDLRLERAESAFLNRLGTIHLHETHPLEGHQLPPCLAVAAPAIDAAWLDPAKAGGDEIWATHATDCVLLQPLTDLVARIGGPQWWPERAAAVAALLAVLPRIADNNASVPAQVLAFGYLVLPRDELIEAAGGALRDLRQALVDAFPDTPIPADACELLDAVTDPPLNTWPATAGRLIHTAGEAVLLDIAAATRHLDLLLELPADQGFSPKRSKEFELAAQALIDASSWSDVDLAPLRGQKLAKSGGGDLTDIDAIGSKNGSVLLVDCKSFIYRGSYEAGPSNIIKNVADELTHKATHMKDVIVPELQAHMPPVFAGRQSVIGVVCTPVPLYTPLGDATEAAAPELPRVVSLLEFKRWLAEH